MCQTKIDHAARRLRYHKDDCNTKLPLGPHVSTFICSVSSYISLVGKLSRPSGSRDGGGGTAPDIVETLN